MTKSIFVQAFDEAEKYLFCRVRKEMDHRRFLCFAFLTIIELIVLPAYLLGQGGRLGWPFTLMATLQTAVFITMEVCVWTKHMDMRSALATMLGTIYARLAVEVILCSFWCDVPHTSMIIGNYVMFIAAILFCIEAKLGSIPIVMCIISPVVFIVSAIRYNDPVIISSLWYSLKEICDIMKKGESNISSQRSHIRKKLGMQRDDNMRMFLEQRLYSNSAFRGGKNAIPWRKQSGGISLQHKVF